MLSEQDEQDVNRLAERMSSIGYMDFEKAEALLTQILSAWQPIKNELEKYLRENTNNWRKMHGLPMIRRR